MSQPNRAFVLIAGIQPANPNPGSPIEVLCKAGVLDSSGEIVPGAFNDIFVELDYSDNFCSIRRKVASACRVDMEDPSLDVVFIDGPGGAL